MTREMLEAWDACEHCLARRYMTREMLEVCDACEHCLAGRYMTRERPAPW